MDSVGKKKHGTVPGCPTWTSSEECQFLTRNSFLLESRWQGVRIWTWTIVCPVRPWSRHLTPVQKLVQGINSLFVFFCCNDSGCPLVDVYNLDEFHPLPELQMWMDSIHFFHDSMTHDYFLKNPDCPDGRNIPIPRKGFYRGNPGFLGYIGESLGTTREGLVTHWQPGNLSHQRFPPEILNPILRYQRHQNNWNSNDRSTNSCD